MSKDKSLLPLGFFALSVILFTYNNEKEKGRKKIEKI